MTILQTFKLSNVDLIDFSNFQIFKFSNLQTFKLSKFDLIDFKLQTFKLSNFQSLRILSRTSLCFGAPEFGATLLASDPGQNPQTERKQTHTRIQARPGSANIAQAKTILGITKQLSGMLWRLPSSPRLFRKVDPELRGHLPRYDRGWM